MLGRSYQSKAELPNRHWQPPTLEKD